MLAEQEIFTTDQYQAALVQGHMLAGAQGIDAALADNDVIALVAPTGSPAWTTDLVNGDHFLGSVTGPSAIAGYPIVQVPAGYSFGLPVGISFLGTAYSEPVLIKLAYAYEQASKVRRAPTFQPTLPPPQGINALTGKQDPPPAGSQRLEVLRDRLVASSAKARAILRNL